MREWHKWSVGLLALVISLVTPFPGSAQSETKVEVDGNINAETYTGDGQFLTNISLLADGVVTAANLGIARMAFVGDSGSATTNCTNLKAAITSLTGPAAVVLGPGTYECVGAVLMKDMVSVIGAGERLTTITASVNGAGAVTAGLGEGELRHLTVVNTFDATGTSLGVFLNESNLAMSHVTVVASDASNSIAISILGGTPSLEHVTAMAGDPGVGNFNSYGINPGGGAVVTMNDVVAISTASSDKSYGLFLPSGTVTARDSMFAGTTAAVETASAANTVNLVASQVDSGITGPGTFTCVSSFDESFAELDTDWSAIP